MLNAKKLDLRKPLQLQTNANGKLLDLVRNNVCAVLHQRFVSVKNVHFPNKSVPMKDKSFPKNSKTVATTHQLDKTEDKRNVANSLKIVLQTSVQANQLIANDLERSLHELIQPNARMFKSVTMLLARNVVMLSNVVLERNVSPRNSNANGLEQLFVKYANLTANGPNSTKTKKSRIVVLLNPFVLERNVLLLQRTAKTLKLSKLLARQNASGDQTREENNVNVVSLLRNVSILLAELFTRIVNGLVSYFARSGSTVADSKKLVLMEDVSIVARSHVNALDLFAKMLNLHANTLVQPTLERFL